MLKDEWQRGSGSDVEKGLQASWEKYIIKNSYKDTVEVLNNLVRKFAQDNIGELVLPTSVRGKLKTTSADAEKMIKMAVSKLGKLSPEDRKAAIEMALEANARHLAGDLDGDGYVSIIRDVINMDKILSTIQDGFNENGGQLIVNNQMFLDQTGVIRMPAVRGRGLREISEPELVQLIAETPHVMESQVLQELMKTTRLTLVFDQDKKVIFLAKADVDKRTGRVKKVHFDAKIKTSRSGGVGLTKALEAFSKFGADRTMSIEPVEEINDTGLTTLLGDTREGYDKPYTVDISPGMMSKFATIIGRANGFRDRKDSIKESVLSYAVDVGFRISQLGKIKRFLASQGVEMPYDDYEISPEGQADKVIEVIRADKDDSVAKGRVMQITGPLGRLTRKAGEYEDLGAIKNFRIRKVRERATRIIEKLQAELKTYDKENKSPRYNGDLLQGPEMDRSKFETPEVRKILDTIDAVQEAARQQISDIMVEDASLDRMTPTGITALGREATGVERTQEFVDPMLDSAIEGGQSIGLNTVPTRDGRKLPVNYRTVDEKRTNYTKDDVALFRRIRAIQRQGNIGKMTLGAGAVGIGLGLASNAITNRIQFGDQGDEITQANLAPSVALEAIGAVNNTAGAVANLGWVAMNRGDMLRAMVNLFGSLGGGIIGGAAGALTGNPFVAGAGAFVGSNAGSVATDTLYSAITGNNGMQQMPANVATSTPDSQQPAEYKPEKDLFDIYGERV